LWQFPLSLGGRWRSATFHPHWFSRPGSVSLKSAKSRADQGVLASMSVGAALAKRAMEITEARVVKETISLESSDVV
jgi:hypothetical protein